MSAATRGWRLPTAALVAMVSTLAGAGLGAVVPMPDSPSATAGLMLPVVGGVGGPALATRVALGRACGVAYATGTLFVADAWSVRAVNPRTDWLTTPAGIGQVARAAGPLGGGGPAASAILTGACGATADRSGDLLIASTGDNRIRAVAARTGHRYGRVMTAGNIYAVAGNGIAGYDGNGGPATRAELNAPGAVALDRTGDLLIADTGNNRIRIVPGRTGVRYGLRMIRRHIYTIAGNGTAGYDGNGGPATRAELNAPGAVALDRTGDLLIADTGNNRIRVVAASTGHRYGQAMTAGNIYTIAGNGTAGYDGNGGPATRAELNAPGAVALDRTGDLLIADTGN
ncbi:MAG TPA: hypothetical protein VGI74_27305, partial [Streptosporangiaceae bacterium]